jgi:hypothetical protein
MPEIAAAKNLDDDAAPQADTPADRQRSQMVAGSGHSGARRAALLAHEHDRKTRCRVGISRLDLS